MRILIKINSDFLVHVDTQVRLVIILKNTLNLLFIQLSLGVFYFLTQRILHTIIYLQTIYLQVLPTDVVALGQNSLLHLILIRSNETSVLR